MKQNIIRSSIKENPGWFKIFSKRALRYVFKYVLAVLYAIILVIKAIDAIMNLFDKTKVRFRYLV